MDACIAEMPETVRATVKQNIDEMRDAWSGVDGEVLEPACAASLETAGSAMREVCPGVAWN
jgi:hypothetical protein